MADQTIVTSYAASGVQPRELCTGVLATYAVYSLSRTLSASDKIYMCKIPDGARIVGMEFMFNNNLFYNAGVVNVGTPANAVQFITSVTPSAGLKFAINTGGGLGAVLDVSDAATNKWTYIQVSVSTAATGTATGSMSLVVLYQMDQ